jgi:hypothetical protein
MLRSLFLTIAFCLHATNALQAQEAQENVILSVERDVVRWAAVYKMQPAREDDPYFHVRVFEHRKGWQPWKFKQLIFHMAVTPKALEASRIDGRAKIYNYKDVEIRAAYRRWLDGSEARTNVPICDTNTLNCITRLP